MGYIGPSPNPGQNREVDDISSGFNGGTASFTLQVNGQNVSPGSANAIIVSLGGVVQNPGTDYTVAASTITFTTNPASGLSFFGLVLGQQVDTADANFNDPVITGDLSIADKIVHTGDTNNAIRFPAADTITAETSGSERLRIDSSGRVMIGTTAEGETGGDQFTIAGSGNTGITIRGGTTSDTNIFFSDGTSGSDEFRGIIRYQHNSNRFEFFTDASRRMIIDSSGKVGIGTDSPANLLHVKGSGHDKLLLETTGTAHSVGVQMKHASGNAAEQVWQLQTNAGASTQRDLSVRDATAGTFIATFRKGGGITFNGDTAAANALNDYEEGTHTTTVTISGNTSFSYSDRTLAYTKIGRLVHVVGRLQVTGASSGSTFSFTLPFTNGDGVEFETSNNFQIIRGDTDRSFRIRSNESVASLENASGSVTNTGSGNPHINVNLTYFTDS